MALNGYSEKDSRHSRFSVKPVGSSANTFEPASGSLSIVIPTLNAVQRLP